MTYQDIENKVVSILGRYGAQTIGIFGSYARGAQRPDSDLDLLVNFKERKSLLTLVRIERELSESIGVSRPTYRGLYKSVFDRSDKIRA